MPDVGAAQARVLHHGDLAGELGQEADRPMYDIVEVDRADQEALDRPALGRGERLDPGQFVDEQPVSPICGYPSRAGVRLVDIPLLFQHGHVVAHGGRGHPQMVPLDQRLAADRLLGLDVVLDDRAQNLELAVVQRHRRPPPPVVGTPSE